MKSIEQLFFELIRIPSATGREAMTEKYIEQYLRLLKFKTWQDSAGNQVGSNCGNLYAYWEVDPSFDTVVFSAHMDTVCPFGKRINIATNGLKVVSDGQTILGADNRAGIAVLLGIAQKLLYLKLRVNILLFFPIHEESGLMGSSLFKFDQKVKYVLNVDESMRPGNFVYASLSHLSFSIIVKGRAVHAAKSYDKGINAIVVASNLVSSLELGVNRKEGWTMNVGKIEGGSSTNVVPDKVMINGELRAFDKDVLENKLSVLKTAIKKWHKRSGADIELILNEHDFVPPLNGKKITSLSRLVKQASLLTGLRPRFSRSYSSSDANSFAHLGYQVLSVARGGGRPHALDEYIYLEDLVTTQKLLEQILLLC